MPEGKRWAAPTIVAVLFTLPAAAADAGTALGAPRFAVGPNEVPAQKLKGGRVEAWVLASPESGSSSGALSVVKVSPGAELTLHKHLGAEVIYLLQGQATVTDPVVARWTELGEGETVYLPAGNTHGFLARGKAPAVAVMFWGPPGPERRLAGNKDETTKDLGPGDKSSDARPFRSKSKQFKIGADVSARLLFDKAMTGDGAIHLSVFTVKESGAIPEHAHDQAEYFYVLSGRGQSVVGGSSASIGSGWVVHVPPKTRHSFSVASEEPLKMLQFFAPSPEKRFGANVIKTAGSP